MTGKLDMVLTHYWFDEILAGRKTCEYRRVTPYWTRRIGSLKKGDYLIFRRGYTNRLLARRVERIRILDGWKIPNDEHNFFKCPNESKFFEIKFG